ncbi:transcriptional regulator Spx [Enterococcus sp. LJL128]|uniref:transcriptional regulator Spx n=1 Tax=Enterococcus sp. LJL51 TaxID=3416656 RepID=UPI003CEE7A76
MITVYTSPSCTSCRKAKKWLEDHDIPYVEKNFFKVPLTRDELLNMLRYTETGTSELISQRSMVYQKLSVNLDELSISELLDLIQENTSLLRRPIIIDDYRMQVGFNEDEIRVFLPREVRKQELTHALLLTGVF